MDSNERCTSTLPNSSGLRWRWYQNYSNKILKGGNSVSLNSVTTMQKNDLVFLCLHTNAPQWVLIKGSQYSSQDQEVRNGFKIS
jgi:hypothetical protein